MDVMNMEMEICNSMDLHLAEMNRIPLLSEEEEMELGQLILEGGQGAREARNRLVMANLRLAFYFAKQYVGRGIDLEDLNIMGQEGLIHAAEKFDYTRGIKFSTYAAYWIKQSIYRGIVNESDNIRIPIRMNEIMNKVRKTHEVLLQQFGAEPTMEEIAESTGLSLEAVQDAYSAMHTIISIDMNVGEDGDTTVADFVADERQGDPCDIVAAGEYKDAIAAAFRLLDSREEAVLKLRFGIDGEKPMSLEEIANHPQFSISRERVRQIEQKAIRKIQRNPKVMNLLSDFVA